LALIATAIGPLFGVPAVLAQSVTITGQVATSGYVSIGNASFNTPTVTAASFSPSSDLSPAPPDAPNNVPMAGYQGGVFVNGANPKMVYFPWMVANGGTTWQDTIKDGIPQSVILEYTPGGSGITQFNTNPSDNWKFFNMNTAAIGWFSYGTTQAGNAAPNLPAGYQGGAVDANGYVYPAPIGTPGTDCPDGGSSPCGGGAAVLPCFRHKSSGFHASSCGYCRAFSPAGPRLLRRCITGPPAAMPGLDGIAEVTDASC
jgi:hypothetical protein